MGNCISIASHELYRRSRSHPRNQAFPRGDLPTDLQGRIVCLGKSKRFCGRSGHLPGPSEEPLLVVSGTSNLIAEVDSASFPGR